MTEETLQKYFDNKVSADILTSDIKVHQLQADTTIIKKITDDDEYIVSRQNLLKLCDDTINGQLSTTDLNTIAFCLIGSDYFHWDSETVDGKVVATTIFDWDNPTINYPLTKDNLLLWKKYLQTNEYTLGKDKH
jgi:hypothetical protein